MITQNDIVKMQLSAYGTMSTGAIIRELLNEDRVSVEYKRALDGERYYDAAHDILTHNFRVENVESTVTNDAGQEVPTYEQFVNPNRSNERLPSPFFYIHTAQKVQYTLGKEPSVSMADESAGSEEYQTELAKTTDAAFMDVIKDWATKASTDGRAWLHEYKDTDGALKQAVIGRLNGIPIYDARYQKQLESIIYHYEIDVRISRQETKKRTIAEWWTAKDVTYWYADGDEDFKEDPERPGSQPHYWEIVSVTGADGVTFEEKSRTPKSWGRVPFIELMNNSEGMTDLARYKGLIDGYDMILSMGTNNLLDFNEFWLAIQGYGGETGSAIARKLKINHAINVNGQGGNITMNQLSLDMPGRIAWLQLLRDAIHEFGMAVDIKSEHFGNSPSGVSLKFQYTFLDMKADMLISKMRSALKKHFQFVTEEINRRNGTDYDSEPLEITFNKTMITNDAEMVQSIIVPSQDIVPDRILLAAHPLVTDPDEAMKEMDKQRKQRMKEAQASMPAYGSEDEKSGSGDE